MRTLTITDAKKHLGRWLEAAARGEDIGVISGANIIALRKIDVQPMDYLEREYGATRADALGLEAATERRYTSLKRSGRLIHKSASDLQKLLE